MRTVICLGKVLSMALIFEVEINTEKRQFSGKFSNPYKPSATQNTTLRIHCVSAARKSSIRDPIMFSIEGFEHFRRSQPSSRAGTLIFHESSGKTFSFPSTQCDNYANQKSRTCFWNIKLVVYGTPQSLPFLFFHTEAWGASTRSYCPDHEPAQMKECYSGSFS